MLFRKLFLISIISVPLLYAADWVSSYQTMIAFEGKNGPHAAEGNRPGYVKPLATYFSTVQNGNWLTSATVPKNLSFEIGLPFTLAFIADKDRTYSSAGVATIFGGKEEYVYNEALGRNVIGGNEDLNGLGVFTLPTLQTGVGFYHAKILLRGMWFPSVSELKSYGQLGFALQYSFGQFFREYLPPAIQSLNASLLYGYNSTSVSYTPEDFGGSLDLDFYSHHFMVAFGYSPVKMVEIMLSLGYETSRMESSGRVWQNSSPSDVIFPGISVKGRSGFRMGFEVAFSLGEAFSPVVGAGIGAANSINTNLIYFKQTFGSESKE